jgi:hypothetical protein
MAQPKYYSPRLARALISPLYHKAKAQRIPMTVLASRLVEEGLARLVTGESERSCEVVAEEPPAYSRPKQVD